jgi:MFS family permease
MLYLSFFYTSEELIYRTGIWYSSTAFAAAFGGLLASGLVNIRVREYIAWPWIFFVEGALTIVLGIGSFAVLPNTPECASFLTSEEKSLAVRRLRTVDYDYLRQGQGTSQETEAAHSVEDSNGNAMARDTLNWKAVKLAIFNPLTLMMATACFLCVQALYSYVLFLPTIIYTLVVGMGEPNHLRVNLMTVPPNIAAFIFTLGLTWWSQKSGRRGIPLIMSTGIAAIGYALLLIGSRVGPGGSLVPAVQYAGTFFVGMGVSSVVPIAVAWITISTSPHYVRAVVLGFVTTVGNLASFSAVFTYIKEQEPQ